MSEIYATLQSSINSDGLWHPSVSIYYSGCDKINKCKECHNPSLQNSKEGFKTTTNQLIKDIEKYLIDWLDVYDKVSICYVGGEPLAIWNRESMLNVSSYFKKNYKDKICNILYSWRELEDLNNLEKYLINIDYGVLGEFQIQNKDLNYIPSSTNQYIYDFKNKKKLSPIRKDLD